MLVLKMSKNKKNIYVVLSFFSGRPSPSWKLNDKTIGELKSKITDLPAKNMEEPTGLGYKGFVIHNNSKIKGLPETIIAFNKTIFIKEKKKLVSYEDINGIEEWLFMEAIEQGHEKIIESIKSHREEKEKSSK